MSTTVDQRVVEMRFDNSQFEKNVSNTVSSIDKLKQSLNFKGASQGLENINDAAKKVDLNAISESTEKVGLKFSALYTIADQALRNITNSAMFYGKKIVSALTLDPVKAGFSEYETQINAVQTILANTKSKGTTLDDVNGALDELNTYADKTIYNFTEMTRNIGTFTAAGVDLDTSVSAIKGIANLAAVSGSTSQQASTAMYQLSQAMASGTVKLMDWNSVVNAGMGGQVFQDALKETARVHGVAIDDIIKKNGSFRESLSDGWLTTEILTDTLAKFTGDLSKEQLKSMGYTEEQIKGIMELGQTANDAATKVKTFSQLWDTLKEAAQSGWAQTWEILIGDFEEAKAFLTEMSDLFGGLIGESAKTRNELLTNWKAMGGRNDLLDSIRNIIEALSSVVTPIKEAFADVFPPMTAERLLAFTRGLKEFTSRLKISDKTADNLRRTFRGIFAVVSVVIDIFSSLFKAFGKVLGATEGLGGGLLGITAAIGDILVWMSELIRSSNIFSATFTIVANIVKVVVGILADIAVAIGEAFSLGVPKAFMNLISKFGGRFQEIADATGNFGDKVKEVFSSLGEAVQNSPFYKALTAIWKLVKTVFSAVGSIISNVFNTMANAIGEADFQGVMDIINSLIAGGIGVGLVKLITSIANIFKNISKTTKGFTDMLDGITGAFEAFQNKLKADVILTIAKAIVLLVAAILVLSFIDQDKMMTALAGIGILFAEMVGAIAVLRGQDKKLGESTVSIGNLARSMLAMAAGILLLAFAVKTISSLSLEELGIGLLGVGALMFGLAGAMKMMQVATKDEKVIVKCAGQMILVAFAIRMLVAPLMMMSKLNFEEMIIGLIGIAGLMGGLTVAMKILQEFVIKDQNVIVKGASQMIIMALAIRMLVAPLMMMAQLSWEKLGKAGASLAGLLGSLVVAQFVLSKFSSKSVKGAAGLVIMASAIMLIVNPLMKISLLPWENLIKAGASLAGLLIGLVGAQFLLSKFSSDSVKGAAGLVIMASAIMLIVNPLMKISLLPWENLIKAGISLVAILGLLLGAQALLSKFGSVKGAAGLVIMASAIMILVPALITLGLVPTAMIVKSLVTIAAALVIFGVAAAALSGIAPMVLTLATSFTLVGAGIYLTGLGLIAMGAGFTSISVGLIALAKSFEVIFKSISVIAKTITVMVSAVIVGILKGVAEGIIAFCDVILAGITSITKVIKTLVQSVLTILLECVPQIVDVLLAIVTALLQSLAEYTPQIVASLFQLLVGIINAIADYLPDLIQAAVNLLWSFINGCIEALGAMDTSKLFTALKSVGLLAGILAILALLTPLVPLAMVGVIGMTTVIGELTLLLAAIGGLAQIPGLEWLISEGGNFLQTIGTAIGQFVGGLVGGFGKGVASSLPEIGAMLSQFMINLQPFIVGAQALNRSMLDGVKALIEIVLALTAVNIVEKLTSWLTGGSSISKFSAELILLGAGLKGFGQQIAGINVDSFTAVVQAAKTLAEMTNYIPNSGGIVSWFTGDNSIAKFGAELILLGTGLKGFAIQTAGIVPESITAAANAAKSLADLTNYIPNSGGIVSWFTGENSIAKFGAELILLGAGLKGFAVQTAGIVPENLTAAAGAAKALAEMTNHIPNTGGVAAWFTGENSIANFSNDLVKLGQGLKGFATVTMGITPETVTAAANAAKILAEMTNSIPNSGGVVSWFTGENSVSKFGNDLISLGQGLKGFATVTMGITPETITAAANSAKILAEMTNHIPNSGGMVSWFTGEASVSKFSSDLISLGLGLKGFAVATVGIVPESITAAANAAKSLAQMTNYIPNSGGIVTWWSGDNSVAKFGAELIALGLGLKGFAMATLGINPESITAAANAAKSLAQMTTYIPNEGGIKAWWAGDISVANFGAQLPILGMGLKGFSDSVAGINAENVVAAANAAKPLAEMTAVIPKEGGIKAWFTGETAISKFSGQLPSLGKGLKGFSDSVAGINPENVTAAASAAKSLGQMTSTIPKNTDKIIDFGENLGTFGGKLKSYFSKMSEVTAEAISSSTKAIKAVKETTNIDAGSIKSTASAIGTLADEIKDLKKIPKDVAKNFTKALKDLGESSSKDIVKGFKDVKSDMKKVGEEAIKAFINGVKAKLSDAKKACKNLVSDCAEAMETRASKFKSAGKNLVIGFAEGISANTYRAEAKAKAMASAAAKAAKKELDINSPSKVFMGIGESVPEGFAMGIGHFGSLVKSATKDMSKEAIKGVGKSISNIADMVNSDIDTQPTIRPVLDLSDIRSGANSIANMFGVNPSVGVLANVGTISSMMNNRNQNGANSDIISAIEKLGQNKPGDVYNINGITYDDGSNIVEAVSTLVRAAKIERRR